MKINLNCLERLLIILSLLLTTLSWSKDVNFNDLVKRDGLWYEKFTDKPFTGKSTGLKQGKVKDGKKDGEWLEYFESGQLYKKYNYKDGKKEGEQFYYYENGKLRSKVNYRYGKTEGERLWYYENGQLGVKGMYKNDKRENEWFFYYENGQLRLTEIYKDGKVIETIRP